MVEIYTVLVVSKDVSTSKVVVVVVVGWLVRPVVPSFGVLVVVDKGVLAVVNSFSVTVSVVFGCPVV